MFQEAGLPYMVVGAHAVMAHGVVRSSGDIGFVVHLPSSEKARVAAVLRKLGHDEIQERKDERGFRLVVETSGGLEVEVFPTPPKEVLDREYQRRVERTLRGQPIPFIGPEDLVLHKLVNTRLRRGPDLEDAVGVIAVQKGAIDLAWLRRACSAYRVCEVLEQAIQAAEAAERR